MAQQRDVVTQLEVAQLARAVDYAARNPLVHVGTQDSWQIYVCTSDSQPDTAYLAGVRFRFGKLETRCECPAGNARLPRACKHTLTAALEMQRGEQKLEKTA